MPTHRDAPSIVDDPGCQGAGGAFRVACASGAEWVRRLHGDQRGVTSVLSLVAVLAFTMLLVMLTNVVRHVDDKVRLQNAADAAAFSGGVVLARGMNAIALANHLQAETFALTALLRTLESRGSVAAGRLVPVMEFILGAAGSSSTNASGPLLTAFQRDVLVEAPLMARDAALEIALRHGLRRGAASAGAGQVRSQPGTSFGPRGPLRGVLWRDASQGPAVAVGAEDPFDPFARTLPFVDVNVDGVDFGSDPLVAAGALLAAEHRRRAAGEALSAWLLDREQRTGQSDSGLAADAREELRKLLDDEFPDLNLPFLLREEIDPEHADAAADYAFLAVVHQNFDREHAPRLFRNPLAESSTATAYAQVQVLLPRPRLRCCPWVLSSEGEDVLNTDPWPVDWDSFNQTWTAQLAPASPASVLNCLRAPPPVPADSVPPLPLEGVSPWDVERLSTH